MSLAYRVLVTGSRDYDDYPTVEREVGNACARGLIAGYYEIAVVHGDAAGADQLAVCYVTENHLRAMEAAGVMLTHEPHPADWSKGRTSGIARNNHMVALGANECLAFAMPCTKPGPRCPTKDPHPSHGTAHCAAAAEGAGITVHRIGPGWSRVAPQCRNW